MFGFGRLFMILGVVSIVMGLLFTFGGRLNIGKLPGDIYVKKENFTFYFPLMTGIVINLVLSAIAWLYSHYAR